MSVHTDAQLDALRLSQTLRQRLVDFALENHYTRDSDLVRICRDIWSGSPEKGGLVGDLWVEGAFRAKSLNRTLKDLALANQFDKSLADHLDSVGAMPGTRLLYEHQEKAILDAASIGPMQERQALVVTAPTGAGKTECFLLPILDDMFKRERGIKTGMQCLLLYPMNALVNDQVDRLHRWLKGQNRVSLFHFTSETPESAKDADKQGVPSWIDDQFRFRTRDEARGLETHDGRKTAHVGPQPDIVVTNYSMLEYMLCRPQDAVFFGNALRVVVLDEAHLYTGTLAAEITLLLRRLYARCGVRSESILQIATSATLHEGSDELRLFAAKLFTKAAEQVKHIEGKRAPSDCPVALPPDSEDRKEIASSLASGQWLGSPSLVADANGDLSLALDASWCQRLRERLPLLTKCGLAQEEERPAVLLQNAWVRSP